MAASASVNVIVQLLGLGKEQEFVDRFTLSETPAEAHYNYRIQGTSGTEEALALGGVSTIDLIVIKAVSKDLIIDTSYAEATFSEEINLPEGEIAVFKPVDSTIYVMNDVSQETCTYEYLVIGR